MRKQHYNNWHPSYGPSSYVHPVKAQAAQAVKQAAIRIVFGAVLIFFIWFMFLAPKAQAPSVDQRTRVTPEAEVIERKSPAAPIQIPGSSDGEALYAPSDMSDMFDERGIPHGYGLLHADDIHIAGVGNEVI